MDKEIGYLVRGLAEKSRPHAAVALCMLSSVWVSCSSPHPAMAPSRPEVLRETKPPAACPREERFPSSDVFNTSANESADPCMPAYKECLKACKDSICGQVAIVGGCAHLCNGRIEPYLVRAAKFRGGQLDAQCLTFAQRK